jgi:hypothetical protein
MPTSPSHPIIAVSTVEPSFIVETDVTTASTGK